MWLREPGEREIRLHVARDGKEPRPQRAPVRVETVSCLPGSYEHVLDRLLSEFSVAQPAKGVCEELAAVGSICGPDSLFISKGGSQDAFRSIDPAYSVGTARRDAMTDDSIHERINALAREEEEFWARASAEGGLDEASRTRLAALQVERDQAYDLLRQRDAKRSAGEDPDNAEVRPPEIVENYEQ